MSENTTETVAVKTAPIIDNYRIALSFQRILRGLHLYTGELDGIFDAKSSNAMQGFLDSPRGAGLSRNHNGCFMPYEPLPEGLEWSVDEEGYAVIFASEIDLSEVPEVVAPVEPVEPTTDLTETGAVEPLLDVKEGEATGELNTPVVGDTLSTEVAGVPVIEPPVDAVVEPVVDTTVVTTEAPELEPVVVATPTVTAPEAPVADTNTGGQKAKVVSVDRNPSNNSSNKR